MLARFPFLYAVWSCADGLSIEQRINEAKRLIDGSNDQWLIWCGLNKESEMTTKMIPDMVEVTGSDSNEKKESCMLGFSSGDVKRMVTKSKIAGFGMNWQNCSKVIFLSLSDSYEQYYQAVRRCWRFGQERPVTVDIVMSEGEVAVSKNLKRKSRQADRMFRSLVAEMHNSKPVEIYTQEDSGVEVPEWLSKTR